MGRGRKAHRAHIEHSFLQLEISRLQNAFTGLTGKHNTIIIIVPAKGRFAGENNVDQITLHQLCL